MTDGGRQSALDQARILEQGGRIDQAIKAYLSAGASGDAVRLLVSQGRYVDAGNLILRALGVTVADLGRLEGSARKGALKAAQCFAFGGEHRRAAEIYAGLGEREAAAGEHAKASEGAARVGKGTPISSSPPEGPGRAAPQRQGTEPKREAGWRDAEQRSSAQDMMIQELLASGKKGHAARVAWDAGRLEDAARWFLELDMIYEAGMCLHAMGRDEEAIERLMTVSSGHKYFRRAATAVLEACAKLGRFDFEIDHFVSPFASTGPAKKKEVPACLIAAGFYLDQGYEHSAKEILERALRIQPDSAEALSLVERLSPEEAASVSVPPPVNPRRMSMPDLPALDGFAQGGPRKERPESTRGRPVSSRNMTPIPVQLPAPQTTQAAPAPRDMVPTAPPTAGGAFRREAPPPRVVGMPPPSDAVPTMPRAAPVQAAPTPAAPPVSAEGKAGEVWSDRYRLDKELGRGGMAIVWRARDLELDQDIALKLLLPQPGIEELIPRFRQELALARKLVHKNITQVFDIGVHGNTRFISMEMLEGKSLDQTLTRPLNPTVGIPWLVQACAALRVAHDQGIVHRDIKPANFFITKAGVVKLMDFGIAKMSGETGKSLTRAGSLIGTPEYMAPEQIDAPDDVGPATDIYALGVVMFEMFTLHCPFEHAQLTPLLRMIVDTPAPAPRELNPDIPKSLELVMARCLKKKPEDRYGSATELARALRSVMNELR